MWRDDIRGDSGNPSRGVCLKRPGQVPLPISKGWSESCPQHKWVCVEIDREIYREICHFLCSAVVWRPGAPSRASHNGAWETRECAGHLPSGSHALSTGLLSGQKCRSKPKATNHCCHRLWNAICDCDSIIFANYTSLICPQMIYHI